MKKCKEMNVRWAIFSDLHGVIFPHLKYGWYDKAPDSVTEEEFGELLGDFDEKLRDFDEIWFYYNPGRFHRLYKRLLLQTEHKNRLTQFTHLREIG